MNDFFVSIGPKLSSKLPVVDLNINITRVSKTMFLQPTDQWEVAKILKQTRKVMAWMELVMKFSNVARQLLSLL